MSELAEVRGVASESSDVDMGFSARGLESASTRCSILAERETQPKQCVALAGNDPIKVTEAKAGGSNMFRLSKKVYLKNFDSASTVGGESDEKVCGSHEVKITAQLESDPDRRSLGQATAGKPDWDSNNWFPNEEARWARLSMAASSVCDARRGSCLVDFEMNEHCTRMRPRVSRNSIGSVDRGSRYSVASSSRLSDVQSCGLPDLTTLPSEEQRCLQQLQATYGQLAFKPGFANYIRSLRDMERRWQCNIRSDIPRECMEDFEIFEVEILNPNYPKWREVKICCLLCTRNACQGHLTSMRHRRNLKWHKDSRGEALCYDHGQILRSSRCEYSLDGVRIGRELGGRGNSYQQHDYTRKYTSGSLLDDVSSDRSDPCRVLGKEEFDRSKVEGPPGDHYFAEIAENVDSFDGIDFSLCFGHLREEAQERTLYSQVHDPRLYFAKAGFPDPEIRHSKSGQQKKSLHYGEIKILRERLSPRVFGLSMMWWAPTDQQMELFCTDTSAFYMTYRADRKRRWIEVYCLLCGKGGKSCFPNTAHLDSQEHRKKMREHETKRRMSRMTTIAEDGPHNPESPINLWGTHIGSMRPYENKGLRNYGSLPNFQKPRVLPLCDSSLQMLHCDSAAGSRQPGLRPGQNGEMKYADVIGRSSSIKSNDVESMVAQSLRCRNSEHVASHRDSEMSEGTKLDYGTIEFEQSMELTNQFSSCNQSARRYTTKLGEIVGRDCHIETEKNAVGVVTETCPGNDDIDPDSTTIQTVIDNDTGHNIFDGTSTGGKATGKTYKCIYAV